MSEQLAPLTIFRSWDNNGAPLVGGKLFAYIAGSTTKQPTYTDSTGSTPNTNPVILNFRGEANVWLDPTLIYKLVLAPSTDTDPPTQAFWTVDNVSGGSLSPSGSIIPTVDNLFTLGNASFAWANVFVGPNHAPVLDTVSGNIGYYGRTLAEIAASATPINFSYPPMYVDRYATNTTPGTTSMAAAFQAAINVCRAGGGMIRYGATGKYLVDATLDCTFNSSNNQFGLHFRDEGNTSQDANTTIIFKHTGYGFDLTGCDAYTFEHCTIGTDPTTFPKVCFFQARANVAGTNSQLPRFLHTKVVGKFSVAVQYNYGAEDGVYEGSYWVNQYTGAGGRVIYLTANNILGLTSSFVTIRTGNQSCIDHEYIGGQYLMLSSDAAADVWYLDQIGFLKIFGSWAACSNPSSVGGRSIIFVDMTNGPTTSVHLCALETENLITQNVYGITFSNVAGTVSGWRIDGCHLPALTNAIFAPALVILDSFFVTKLAQVANNGINCTNMQFSSLDIGPQALTISGTSTSNFIVAFEVNMTVPTRVKTVVVDLGNGSIRMNGALGLFNNAPPTQVAGFGTPTGAVVVANFPGATATLLQTSNTVAEILTILKNVGFIAT